MHEFLYKGPLKEALAKFKNDFLSRISKEDFDQEVVLSIGKSEEGNLESKNLLRQQLLSILEEE